MASYGYTFTSGDSVTPTKLNNARTVSEIVNADINASAAIAGTKIAPNFGSQNVVTTGFVGAGVTSSPYKIHARADNSGAATWVACHNDSSTAGSSGGYLAIANGANNYTQLTQLVDGTANLYKNGANGSLSVGTLTATPLLFVTNNTGRCVIDASGNVGVGTAAPTGKLGIAVSTGRSIGSAWDDKSVLIGSPGAFSGNLGLSFDTTNGSTIESAAPGVAAYPVRIAGSQLQAFTSNVERVRIDSNGNIGVGTTTPSSLLHVYAPSSATYARLENGATADTYLSFKNAGSAEESLVGLSGAGTGTYLWDRGARPVIFGSSNAERVRVTAGGNVGVGTSSPSSRLHIDGDLTMSSATTTAGAGAVVGYLVVNINGTSRKIPVHAS